MRDILPEVEEWRARGDTVAIATVVGTQGSSPRPRGAKLAINGRGEMVGSVSGGCLEGAVFEESQEVLKTGRPKLLHYGISSDLAWEVGLSCGGAIDIYIERFDW